MTSRKKGRVGSNFCDTMYKGLSQKGNYVWQTGGGGKKSPICVTSLMDDPIKMSAETADWKAGYKKAPKLSINEGSLNDNIKTFFSLLLAHKSSQNFG